MSLNPVRLVVGALLLVFGLQWLRKGVLRVTRDGWGVGQSATDADGVAWPGDQVALLVLGAVYVVAARRDTTQRLAQQRSASAPSPSGIHR